MGKGNVTGIAATQAGQQSIASAMQQPNTTMQNTTQPATPTGATQPLRQIGDDIFGMQPVNDGFAQARMQQLPPWAQGAVNQRSVAFNMPMYNQPVQYPAYQSYPAYQQYQMPYRPPMYQPYQQPMYQPMMQPYQQNVQPNMLGGLASLLGGLRGGLF